MTNFEKILLRISHRAADTLVEAISDFVVTPFNQRDPKEHQKAMLVRGTANQLTATLNAFFQEYHRIDEGKSDFELPPSGHEGNETE